MTLSLRPMSANETNASHWQTSDRHRFPSVVFSFQLFDLNFKNLYYFCSHLTPTYSAISHAFVWLTLWFALFHISLSLWYGICSLAVESRGSRSTSRHYTSVAQSTLCLCLVFASASPATCEPRERSESHDYLLSANIYFRSPLSASSALSLSLPELCSPSSAGSLCSERCSLCSLIHYVMGDSHWWEPKEPIEQTRGLMRSCNSSTNPMHIIV